MPKVLVWNVRGLNKTSKHSIIASYIKLNNISLVCFLETKMTVAAFNNYILNKWPGWMFENNFDFISGGRMAIMWNPNLMDCVFLEKESQHLHTRCTCRITQTSFFATFVYPLYTVLERKALWDHLTLVGDQISDPWMICGDFNCICAPNERVGPTPPTAYVMQHLFDFKVANSLEDAPSTGEFYTWNRGALWAKLDRVLINDGWGINSIGCRVHFHEMELEFDHTASVVSILLNSSSRPKPFKFFNMWLKHSEFANILAMHWNQTYVGTAQFTLVKKLKGLKRPLKALNATEFGHISSKAKTAKDEFKRLHKLALQDPGDQELKAQLSEASKRAIFLGEAEATFFQQRAKATHILEADKCTKYFHAIVKRNLARNTISSLTLEDDFM
ncbi:unnamed protein product [Cuscuta epithymum]|uniref:Endonuclease/exonuclease/phosphatase domain-containing protein n=1 Tax=Cuscuta epithymum TaxID=186058 RepID=A0AAV0CVA8_9ASTE|nr:unnamed protein product [Cuscuta epithymum]